MTAHRRINNPRHPHTGSDQLTQLDITVDYDAGMQRSIELEAGTAAPVT